MSTGRLTRYALPYTNVIASGTATNTITPGYTIEMLRLRLGGGSLTKSMITMFRLKVNGKIVIEGTGNELDKINAYRGESTNAAFLDIQWADYKMVSELDRQIGSFDTTRGIQNITTEITTSGATTPTITPILIQAGAQNAPSGEPAPFSGLMTKILKYPFNISTAGKLPFNTPFGPQNGAVIKRVHVMHTGNMTDAVVKQDGLVLFEAAKVENEFDQTKNGRVPQSNMFTIDFVVDGNIKKSLDTRDARSLEWLFTFSAADSGSVIVEYLDTLANN